MGQHTRFGRIALVCSQDLGEPEHLSGLAASNNKVWIKRKTRPYRVIGCFNWKLTIIKLFLRS